MQRFGGKLGSLVKERDIAKAGGAAQLEGPHGSRHVNSSGALNRIRDERKDARRLLRGGREGGHNGERKNERDGSHRTVGIRDAANEQRISHWVTERTVSQREHRGWGQPARAMGIDVGVMQGTTALACRANSKAPAPGVGESTTSLHIASSDEET
ncbi:MAG: hypothetical protein RhofKO_19090 [Rhodothermales bacterium]